MSSQPRSPDPPVLSSTVPDTTGAEPREGHVAVGGLRLHWLDWGGRGEPLVLLPGMGQSAHVFRDLAPLLFGGMRVIALTPRAHGTSDAAPSGYAARDFAREVGGFLDAVGVERAALAGHSMAGPVITRFAADHPERVSRLVYLDGVLDRAAWGPVQARTPFRPPPPPVDASHTDAEEREWLRRYVYGFWTPTLEADARARPPRAERGGRREMLLEMVEDAMEHAPPYRALRAPALALAVGETVRTHFPWLDPDDAAAWERAEAYLRDVRQPWRRAEEERFVREAPGARVERAGEHHFLHLADPARVAAAMLPFLTGEAG